MGPIPGNCAQVIRGSRMSNLQPLGSIIGNCCMNCDRAIGGSHHFQAVGTERGANAPPTPSRICSRRTLNDSACDSTPICAMLTALSEMESGNQVVPFVEMFYGSPYQQLWVTTTAPETTPHREKVWNNAMQYGGGARGIRRGCALLHVTSWTGSRV